MRKYSKAYYLKDFRAYDGWAVKDRDDAEELTDDSILYLQDNYTVVKDVFDEEDYVFDDVTDEWKAFCHDTLDFQIPEDLRYAYEEDADTGGDEEASAPDTGEDQAEA